MRCAIFMLAFFSANYAFPQVFQNTPITQNVVYLEDVGSRDNLPADSIYYTLPAEEFWYNQPWRDSVYLFPRFQEGRLEFATGFSPSIRLMMNYNALLETIDIKDQRGITTLKRFPELKIIWIGDHKFFYHPGFGYLEIIMEGNLSVAKKSIMASLAEMSDQRRFRMVGFDTRRSDVNYKRYYWPAERYFILEPNYRPHRAGALTLPTMLPQIKDRIRDFAAMNQTDYRKREDVLKIVAFCNEIYDGPINSGTSDILRIPADGSLEKSAWRDSLYMFRSFEEALTVLDNGRRGEPQVVNYNFSTGWFDTIDKRGDTVVLSTDDRIHIATIDDVTLMNDRVNGLIEVVMHGKVSLGLKKRIVMEGTYNVKVDSLVGSNTLPREKIYYIRREYFFMDKTRALPANVRTVLALFRHRKDEVLNYISVHRPDFESEKDMMDLLSYCSQL